MKFTEIKNKSREELRDLLKESREKLLKLNFDLADNKVKDFSQLRKTKKDVARVLMTLNNIK